MDFDRKSDLDRTVSFEDLQLQYVVDCLHLSCCNQSPLAGYAELMLMRSMKKILINNNSTTLFKGTSQ